MVTFTGDGCSLAGEIKLNCLVPSKITWYKDASTPLSVATTVYSPIGDEERETCLVLASDRSKAKLDGSSE